MPIFIRYDETPRSLGDDSFKDGASSIQPCKDLNEFGVFFSIFFFFRSPLRTDRIAATAHERDVGDEESEEGKSSLKRPLSTPSITPTASSEWQDIPSCAPPASNPQY